MCPSSLFRLKLISQLVVKIFIICTSKIYLRRKHVELLKSYYDLLDLDEKIKK